MNRWRGFYRSLQAQARSTPSNLASPSGGTDEKRMNERSVPPPGKIVVSLVQPSGAFVIKSTVISLSVTGASAGGSSNFMMLEHSVFVAWVVVPEKRKSELTVSQRSSQLSFDAVRYQQYKPYLIPPFASLHKLLMLTPEQHEPLSCEQFQERSLHPSHKLT